MQHGIDLRSLKRSTDRWPNDGSHPDHKDACYRTKAARGWDPPQLSPSQPLAPERNVIVAMFGETGAGKTTTLMAMVDAVRGGTYAHPKLLVGLKIPAGAEGTCRPAASVGPATEADGFNCPAGFSDESGDQFASQTSAPTLYCIGPVSAQAFRPAFEQQERLTPFDTHANFEAFAADWGKAGELVLWALDLPGFNDTRREQLDAREHHRVARQVAGMLDAVACLPHINAAVVVSKPTWRDTLDQAVTWALMAQNVPDAIKAKAFCGVVTKTHSEESPLSQLSQRYGFSLPAERMAFLDSARFSVSKPTSIMMDKLSYEENRVKILAFVHTLCCLPPHSVGDFKCLALLKGMVVDAIVQLVDTTNSIAQHVGELEKFRVQLRDQTDCLEAMSSATMTVVEKVPTYTAHTRCIKHSVPTDLGAVSEHDPRLTACHADCRCAYQEDASTQHFLECRAFHRPGGAFVANARTKYVETNRLVGAGQYCATSLIPVAHCHSCSQAFSGARCASEAHYHTRFKYVTATRPVVEVDTLQQAAYAEQLTDKERIARQLHLVETQIEGHQQTQRAAVARCQEVCARAKQANKDSCLFNEVEPIIKGLQARSSTGGRGRADADTRVSLLTKIVDELEPAPAPPPAVAEQPGVVTRLLSGAILGRGRSRSRSRSRT